MNPIRSTALAGVLVLLSACEKMSPVNPPTEPARAIEIDDPGALPAAGQTSMLPGRGAASFVGRWAGDVAWCAAPQGARSPVEISATRFEGYETSCAIAAVDEVADGYVATLACLAQGQARSERVRFQVTGDVMRLAWLDRVGEPVSLRKCTTLGDTVTTPAVLP
jgi:hypothetical protein